MPTPREPPLNAGTLAAASTGEPGCVERAAGILVIGRSELADTLERDLGSESRVTWAPHEHELGLAVPTEGSVAVVEVGSNDRQSGLLPLERAIKLLRSAMELELVFVLERDSLEPLLRASRSPSVDFVVQPAGLDELSFRVRSALSRASARRWAVHLEAGLESLRLAARIRNVAPAITVPSRVDYREAMRVAHEQAARQYLDSLMRDVKGNVARAAKRAGLERESLHRLLRRHGIRSGIFKGG